MTNIVRRNESSSTQIVDQIEKIVYEHIRPLGFRKHGRTLHRFVDEDISQVIHFQNGYPGKGVFDVLWVNLGIRVPESFERSFTVAQPLKKYYHEYQCNIRNRLGALGDGKDTYYDLRKDPEKIAADIVSRLDKLVLPVYDVLSSREAILEKRGDYAWFDDSNRLRLLDEAMIHGRRGNLEQASKCFSEYYKTVLEEYNQVLARGRKCHLNKGASITYLNRRTNEVETIVAEKSGDVILYDADRAHVDYLEELARNLGIRIKEE